MKIINLDSIRFRETCFLLNIEEYNDFERLADELPIYRVKIKLGGKSDVYLVAINLFEPSFVYLYQEKKGKNEKEEIK